MKKIALICVYNNKTIFESYLLKSVNDFQIDCERIFIDNTDGRYRSAAGAFNFALAETKADVFIFAHQDIYIKNKETFLAFADKVENGGFAVFGAQGAVYDKKEPVTCITCGKEDMYESGNWSYKDDSVEVDTVDEGFFGFNRETSKRLAGFDEALTDGWHLYSVNASLKIRRKGGKVYVVPCQIYHKSMGHISIDYMHSLKKLAAEYRRDFKYIWTTNYKIRTNPLYVNGLIFIWSLFRIIRGKGVQ